LPRLLSENLCSLNPNEDRLAYSCIWWMTPEGNMTNDEPWYGRSVIRSCCKLDYGLAQHMIEETVKDGTTSNVDAWPLDRRPTGGHRCPDVCRDVRLMNRIAKQRRARRYESGALALQGVKLCFQCDHQGNPVETFTYPIKDSNRLVEEYMLLANYLVAQKLILGAGKLASIRRHPTPIPKKMEEFAKQCQERGYDVDIKSAGALHQSLLNIQNNTSIDPIAHYALTTSATVPMKPAVYFAAGTESREQWRHYALNIPYYTHFTSPIRRYADIMVHRLLTAVLTNTVDQFALNTGQIQKILDNCNEKKENSKAAQLRGDTVYFCVFLKHQPRISEAVVMDWGESSFELFVPEYGVSKRVHIDDLNCQSETKPNGFHLRPNNGANKQGKQGEQKNSGGSSNKESIGMYSGCRMMHRNVLPKHGMFVKFLTRMTVKLYHLDKIPVDFALEIQDIYAWEKK
jgi:exoribonuclease R